MIAGSKRSNAFIPRAMSFDNAVEAPRAYAFTVGVRTRLGDDLEGLEAHGDGVSFCSPEPIEGGQLIELVICQAILVEAKVVGCAVMPGGQGGYWVRARYHNTSPAMNELLGDELKRVMGLLD